MFVRECEQVNLMVGCLDQPLQYNFLFLKWLLNYDNTSFLTFSLFCSHLFLSSVLNLSLRLGDARGQPYHTFSLLRSN